MHHDLKIDPQYFQDIVAGAKTLEVRSEADRTFNPHDTITLQEYDRTTQRYSGATYGIVVTHVLRDPECQWFQPNIVALSIRPATPDDGSAYAAMIHDATRRINEAIAPRQLLLAPSFIAWSQTWETTACGFDEMGSALITTRPTFVWRIPNQPENVHVIYHDYRWAYTLRHPSAHFHASVAAWHLPGASEIATIADLNQESFPH